MNIFNFKNKPKKRYILYCPKRFSSISCRGYNTFLSDYEASRGNVIEHLRKIGEMMHWYQIVDNSDDMKVIEEQTPE